MNDHLLIFFSVFTSDPTSFVFDTMAMLFKLSSQIGLLSLRNQINDVRVLGGNC